MRRAQRLGGLPLVPAVAPGVQVADRDRPRPRRAPARRSPRRASARSSGVSMRPSARMRSRTPRRRCARHQRLGRRLAQVVAVVLQPLAHLQHVAMALGGQQADPRALALEQRVGRDRRAVDDALGLGRAARAARCRARPPGAPARPSRPIDGSAGVDGALASVTRPASSTATRSVKVPPTSMPIRYNASALRPTPSATLTADAPAVTKPSSRSRARSSALRSAGSPKPPPPPERTSSTSPGRITMPTSLVLSGAVRPARGVQHVAVRQAVLAAEHAAGAVAHAVARGVGDRGLGDLDRPSRARRRGRRGSGRRRRCPAGTRGGGRTAGSAPRPPRGCRT